MVNSKVRRKVRVRTGVVALPDQHGINGESWRVPAVMSLIHVFPQNDQNNVFFKALDTFLRPLAEVTFANMRETGNYRSCRIFDPSNSELEANLYALMNMYGFVRTGFGRGVEIGIDVDHQRIKLLWMYDGCELAPDVHFLPLDGGTATTLACLREAQTQKTARPDMKPYESAMDKSEYGIRARQKREEDKKKVFKFN